MALSTTERLVVNGADLKTYGRNIDTMGALLTGAGKRGANAIAGNRSGAIFNLAKPHEVLNFVITGWVIGSDDDGNIPGGSTARREFYKRIDEMTALFGGQQDALLVQHTLPDNSVRRIFAECRSGIQFATDSSYLTGRFSIPMESHEAFWEDDGIQTYSVAAGTPLVIPAATAPCEDGVFKITGPITNPKIIDQQNQATFTYTGTVPAGAVMTVDSNLWLVTATGMTVNYANVSMSNTMGRLVRLNVRYGFSLGYSVILSGTATTAATKLDIQLQRKYMVG